LIPAIQTAEEFCPPDMLTTKLKSNVPSFWRMGTAMYKAQKGCGMTAARADIGSVNNLDRDAVAGHHFQYRPASRVIF
jgi:hypothetical protein